MKLFRYFVMTAAVGLAFTAFADRARADGFGFGVGIGCKNCGGGHASKPPTTLFKGFSGFNFNKEKLPVFQAAPWYQYWPYDAHFLTPAPIAGPFYGPPLTGNFPVNPYFPGPAIAVPPPPPGGPVPIPPGGPMPPLVPGR